MLSLPEELAKSGIMTLLLAIASYNLLSVFTKTKPDCNNTATKMEFQNAVGGKIPSQRKVCPVLCRSVYGLNTWTVYSV